MFWQKMQKLEEVLIGDEKGEGVGSCRRHRSGHAKYRFIPLLRCKGFRTKKQLENRAFERAAESARMRKMLASSMEFPLEIESPLLSFCFVYEKRGRKSLLSASWHH